MSIRQPVVPGPVRPAAVWLALGTVYLVWGSTYLAIRVVVDTVPPLLAMSARFVTAAVLLGTILMIRGGFAALRVRPRELGGAAVVGILLVVGGNGAVAVAEQTVPSGITALLIAATPLWLVLLRTTVGDRPRPVSLLGTAVGFLGIAALVHPGASLGVGVQTWGLLTLVGAAMSWALGSFLSSRISIPSDAFVATTWEMLIGGLVMGAVGAATGELDDLSLAAVPDRGWVALAYLILVGSIVGYSAYVWLLHHAPISLTATYAYVNPVVAVVLGALILSEPITAGVLVGGAVVLAGVALVVSAERPRRREPGPTSNTEEEVVDLPA